MTDELPKFSKDEDVALRPLQIPDFDPVVVGRDFEAWVMAEVASSSFLSRPSEYKVDPKNLLLTWRRQIKPSFVERMYFTKSQPGSESQFSMLAKLDLYNLKGDPRIIGDITKYSEDPLAGYGETQLFLPNGSNETDILFNKGGIRIKASYDSDDLVSIGFGVLSEEGIVDGYWTYVSNINPDMGVPSDFLGENVTIASDSKGMRLTFLQGFEAGSEIFFRSKVEINKVVEALISPKLASNPIGAPASADTWLHANLLGLFGIREDLPPGFGKLR